MGVIARAIPPVLGAAAVVQGAKLAVDYNNAADAAWKASATDNTPPDKGLAMALGSGVKPWMPATKP